jgi:twitching motility two-component system response regulator PilG
MSLQKYKSGQLGSVLNSLFNKNSSGILSLTTQVDSWQNQRSSILILHDGALVYGGTQVPEAQEFCRRLGEALKSNFIKAALSVAVQKANNPQSMRELLEALVRVRVFTWQEVEALMNTQVMLVLEKFISHPGEARWEPRKIDLSYDKDRHGLNWSNLQLELKLRQQQWASYQPTIPSMDAVPIVTPQQLRLVNNPQVKEHFRKSVDGNNTLVDIAEKLGKDPLKVAKNYVAWASNGWVSFISILEATQATQSIGETKTSANLANVQTRGGAATISTPIPVQSENRQHLPIVLSVDDSAIIQTTIKRALQEQYNVLLADRATKALEILNEQPVELLLLDLTMPDVDGLEFCRIIRQMPKFNDLPIVMVTARDGLLNKMKGHIAGTSRYLTKPFSPEELREVVHQYINSKQAK